MGFFKLETKLFTVAQKADRNLFRRTNDFLGNTELHVLSKFTFTVLICRNIYILLVWYSHMELMEKANIELAKEVDFKSFILSRSCAFTVQGNICPWFESIFFIPASSGTKAWSIKT